MCQGHEEAHLQEPQAGANVARFGDGVRAKLQFAVLYLISEGRSVVGLLQLLLVVLLYLEGKVAWPHRLLACRALVGPLQPLLHAFCVVYVRAWQPNRTLGNRRGACVRSDQVSMWVIKARCILCDDTALVCIPKNR